METPLQTQIIDTTVFELVKKVAAHALCERAHCGAAIVLDGKVISTGYNAPPRDNIANKKCHIEFSREGRKKPKSDCTCCIHAEWNAIITALRLGVDLAGSVMYFTRVDDKGKMEYSGEPYCTVCSRLALEVGISFWVLWHDTGPVLYDAKTYNDLSFQYHLMLANDSPKK